MNKLIVFVSEEDNYSDRAKKITNDVLNSEFYFLEKLQIKNLRDIVKNNIIFFLTNSKISKNLMNLIRRKKIDCKILNYNFLSKNYNKLSVQKNLMKNRITVPTVYQNNLKFPLYVKSINHSDMIAKVYNFKSLNGIRKNILKKCYFEQSVENNFQKEYKVYFVERKVYFSEELNNVQQKEILTICNKISKILNIDVFSSDIIYNSENYYVIDVNPAPGFWNSQEARIALGRISNDEKK